MNYFKMNRAELEKEYQAVKGLWEKEKEKNYSFDMSRGKPDEKQLDFCMSMMSFQNTADAFKTKNGFDVRNYGLPNGVVELKEVFAELLDVSVENIFLGGNSSLKLMYNVLCDAFLVGLPRSEQPWKKLDKIRFLCPVPGYDRHFTLAERLGIELMPVPLLKTGPDIDVVEKLVGEDESIKGIWCVPKYSNPTGITYSKETVSRFAALQPKAKDFLIMWDNAYFVHDLYETSAPLPNLLIEAEKLGNDHMVFQFVSTSKITLAGGGICLAAASKENILWMEQNGSWEGLGYDKVNQLRHAIYLQNKENVRKIMQKHASILRPKFETVTKTFQNGFGETGIAEWTEPRGGYFINLNVPDHTATRLWELAKEIGVVLTKAGASYPYGINPKDCDIRIAPSNVPAEQIEIIAKLIIVCTKLAVLEKLLNIHS